jgi:hypothetical protein
MAITPAMTTTIFGACTPGAMRLIQAGQPRINRLLHDTFGVAFQLNLIGTSGQMGYIFHKGDDKDPGPDQIFEFSEVWL